MSMLVIDGIKYNLLIPKEEKQLEEFVKKHYNEIFGKESLYFDIKPELRSQAGIGSKPDGIVVVFDRPLYYVVENERAEHGVHDHVVTQISKFNTAFKKPDTKRKIAEAVYNEIHNDPLREYWIKSRVEGELYKFLMDLFSKKPIVAIIIDELLDELREAVDELPLESKIVEFKTFVREDAPSIHAHLFKPLSAGGKTPERASEKKEVREPRPDHEKTWEAKLAWVDVDTREIAEALFEKILKTFGEVSHKSSADDHCFCRGKTSSEKTCFAVLMLTKNGVKVRIRTDPTTFKDPEKWTGDRIYKGWYFKHGQEREFRIATKEQIDYAMTLIKQSYDVSKEGVLESYVREKEKSKA